MMIVQWCMSAMVMMSILCDVVIVVVVRGGGFEVHVCVGGGKLDWVIWGIFLVLWGEGEGGM